MDSDQRRTPFRTDFDAPEGAASNCNALPGLNFTTRLASIRIALPVAGLCPVRPFRSRTEKGSETGYGDTFAPLQALRDDPKHCIRRPGGFDAGESALGGHGLH